METFKLPPAERIRPIVKRLSRAYPGATISLDWRDPLELLVATILSAQSTDERVNMVTPALFRRYPTAQAFAEADPAELEKAVHSTGFFRMKTKAIIGAARMIVEEFGGEVPGTMDELLRLPGVARKTANVVLGTAFRTASGIVVDTHVSRVSQRLELTAHDDPVKIERDLMALVPRRGWISFGHRTLWHGRRICQARGPRCEGCVLRDWCPFGRS